EIRMFQFSWYVEAVQSVSPTLGTHPLGVIEDIGKHCIWIAQLVWTNHLGGLGGTNSWRVQGQGDSWTHCPWLHGPEILRDFGGSGGPGSKDCFFAIYGWCRGGGHHVLNYT